MRFLVGQNGFAGAAFGGDSMRKRFFCRWPVFKPRIL